MLSSRFTCMVKSRAIVLSNTGTATIGDIEISQVLGHEAHGDDYLLLNRCPSGLAPGQSCKFNIILFADDLGVLTTTIYISDNAPGSPQQVPVTASVKRR